MKKSVVIVLVAFIVTLAVVVGSAFYQQRRVNEAVNSTTPSVDKVTIGAIIPLSGDTAAVGVPIEQAAMLAVKEVNAAGGIKGRPLILEIRDGRCDAREAVNAAKIFINVDHVPVIFTGGCSSETLAVTPLAERSQVILFSPAATSPAVTDAGDYVFRNAPSDASQGRLLSEAAFNAGYRKVAVIHEDTDYAAGIATVFQSNFTARGGEIALAAYRSLATDVAAELDQLLGASPDALLLVVQSPSKAGLIFGELTRRGQRLPLLGNDVVLGATDELTQYSDVSEGLVGADIASDETEEPYRQFAARYEATYGESLKFGPYAARSYDAIKLLAAAMSEVGVDPNAIRAYLGRVKDWPGVTGKLTLDENGDPVSGHILKYVVAGTVASTPPVNP